MQIQKQKKNKDKLSLGAKLLTNNETDLQTNLQTNKRTKRRKNKKRYLINSFCKAEPTKRLHP